METERIEEARGLGFFERYLYVWVILCIVAGIILGKAAPGVAKYLDGLAIYVGEAPVVSIPLAVCLFFMMYPIMVKIDFAEVIKAGKSGKPVLLTLFVNWAVKPFTMYGIALFFLGTAFYGLIGPEAVDHVKMPFGLDLPVGAAYGSSLPTGSRSWRCPCGEATWQAVFCWGLRLARPWSWSGAFWPGATTA